jgi:hypothetical protein
VTDDRDPLAAWLHLAAVCVWPFALGYTIARLALDRLARRHP